MTIFGGKGQGQIGTDQVTDANAGNDLFIDPENVAAGESIGTSCAR